MPRTTRPSAAPAFAPPQRVLLADQVAQTIEREIAAQRWREWLPSERSLQRSLNVSRQTVRTALARLVCSGAVVVESHRGYRIAPGAMGRRRPRKTVHEIGLISPEPVYRMPPRFVKVLDLLRGMCAKAGYRLDLLEGKRFVRTTPGRLLPQVVRAEPKACWILLLSTRAMQEWFARSGLPVVVYGNVFPGLPLNVTGIDFHACVRHATGHLLSRGHRRIAFVAYDLSRAGEQESLRGFHEAFAQHREAAAVPLVIERPDDNVPQLCRQIDGLLDSSDRPTAFVISQTHHYATVATHLAERGLRVPDDVSLICRTEDLFLHYLRPTPAFYRANMEESARNLFDLVRRAIEGTAQPDVRRQLIPEFMPGGSVGPPPSPQRRNPSQEVSQRGTRPQPLGTTYNAGDAGRSDNQLSGTRA